MADSFDRYFILEMEQYRAEHAGAGERDWKNCQSCKAPLKWADMVICDQCEGIFCSVCGYFYSNHDCVRAIMTPPEEVL